MEVGELLRRFRLRRAISQEELAIRSGLSAKAISRLELGLVATPRVSSLRLIAAALDLDEHDRHRWYATAQGDGASAPQTGPCYLPYAVSDFIGRTTEISTLHASLTQDRQLVVISAVDGMAGVGKTALAIHVAHDLADRYPDGQLFVDLHGFTPGRQPLTSATALEALLRARGVPSEKIPADLDERAGLWRAETFGRRILVILDNAADVLQVRPLIPGSPSCFVLITSRRRLSTLDGATRLSVDLLPTPEACLLFVNVAGRKAGQDPDGVHDVVNLCGRLPLAIRIAAAKLRDHPTWTVAELAARLRDVQSRLPELTLDDRDVAAALSLSYQGLPAAAGRLYRLLGTLPGDDIEPWAAAALAEVPVAVATELLESLLDNHLLLRHTAGRYTFHDLVRQHARLSAQLDESEHVARQALGRLCDHYRFLAGTAVGLLMPSEQRRLPELSQPSTAVEDLLDSGVAATRLAQELSNMLACAKHPVGAAHPGFAVDLSVILRRYLVDHGHATEAELLHRGALDTCRESGDAGGQGRALLGLGRTYWSLGHYDGAIEHLDAALAFLPATDHDDRSAATSGLGVIYQRRGQYELAMRYHRECGELSRISGNLYGQANALMNLGVVHERLGEYGDALTCYQLALAAHRSRPGTVDVAFPLANLGSLHEIRGEYEQALPYLTEALALTRKHGQKRTEGFVLLDLGTVHRHLGNSAEALDCLRRGNELFVDNRDRHGEGRALVYLGDYYQHNHRQPEAINSYERAIVVAEQTGEPGHRAAASNGLGNTLRSLGDIEQSIRHHQQAAELAEQIGHRLHTAQAHYGLGLSYEQRGEFQTASQHLSTAQDLLASLTTPETVQVRAAYQRVQFKIDR